MALGELVAATTTIAGIVQEAQQIVKVTDSILKEVTGIMDKLRGMSEGSFADILQQKVQKLGEVFQVLIEAFVKIFSAVFEAMGKLARIDENGASNYGSTRI